MTEIGVGMLGYAFMGKAHSNAFKKIAYITWPPPLEPKLIGIAGRDQDAVGEAARRYGYERSEEHTSELQSLTNLVCRLLLEKKKNRDTYVYTKSNIQIASKSYIDASWN